MITLICILFQLIEVEPSLSSILVGDSLDFSVYVLKDGRREVEAEFEIFPKRVGMFKGNRFYATRPGEGIIRAITKRDGRQIGYAYVRVLPKGRLTVVFDETFYRIEANKTREIRFKVFREAQEVEGGSYQIRILPAYLGRVEGNRITAGSLNGRGRIILIYEKGNLRGIGCVGVEVFGGNDPSLAVVPLPRVIKMMPKEEVEFQVLVEEGEDIKRKEFYIYPDWLGEVKGNKFISSDKVGRGIVWIVVESTKGEWGIARLPVKVGIIKRKDLRKSDFRW